MLKGLTHRLKSAMMVDNHPTKDNVKMLTVTGKARKTHLIEVAIGAIREQLTKTDTLQRMREANKAHCKPPLLSRDLSIYYGDARKQHALESNSYLADLEADAEQDAEQALERTDPQAVASVIDKARELYKLRKEISELEEALVPLKERDRKLTQVELPDAMRDAGVGDEFPLEGGWRIRKEAKVVASLPTPQGIARVKDEDARNAMQQRLEKAVEFLVKTGNQGLIKDQFQIQLGKGETNRAKGIENFLDKRNIPYSHGKTVHSATLAAWVREELKEGREVPQELFNTFETITVDLVGPKK